MILRTIIVDDEPLAREGIRLRLKKEKDIHIIGEYDSGKKALSAIKTKKPDLVFLDIQMPAMNGFEVLKRIPFSSKYPHVIFITAYDNHAIEAFRVHALDYLRQPLNDSQFYQALDRARNQFKQMQMSRFAEKVQTLLNSTELQTPEAASSMLTRIALKSGRKIYFLNVDEID